MSEDQSTPGSPSEPSVPSNRKRVRKERTAFAGNDVAQSGVRYIVVPLLGVLLVGGVVALTARPVYNLFKARSGASRARQAELEWKGGKVKGAAANLRSALIMAPREPSVMRAAARLLGADGADGAVEALNQWQMLIASGAATRQDRMEYIGLALKLERNGLAREQLELLLKDTPQDQNLLRGLVQACVSEGESETEATRAREIVKLDPSGWQSLGLLGETLLQSGGVAEIKEGKAILLALAATNVPAQTQATFALANSGRLTVAEARAVIDLLEKKPARSSVDAFVCYVLQAGVAPTNASARLPELLRELSAADLLDRMTAANWLMNHGVPTPAESLIRPEDIRTNVTARLISLELAAQRKDWNGVYSTLAKTNLTIPGLTRASLEVWLSVTNQAGIAQVNNRFKALLQRGISANAVDSNLRYLAHIAETAGATDAAISVHEFRLQRPWSAVNASEAILRLTLGVGPLARRYPALKVRAAAVADDEAAATEYYYLSALLGLDLKNARSGLEFFRKTYPNHPEIILGLAMAAVREGNRDQASAIMEEKPLDPAALNVRLRAAYVYVMGELGQRDIARRVARELNPAQLFPEEQELISRSLN